MTARRVVHVAASVRQRLLNRARAEGRAFQELATLYAMERFLYRLGHSPHADRFVLKGGLMTLTWAGDYARVTRDIDLLGRGTHSRVGSSIRSSWTSGRRACSDIQPKLPWRRSSMRSWYSVSPTAE